MTKEQPQQAINRLWSDRSANYDRIIHDELSSFRAAAWKERISDQVGGRSGLPVIHLGPVGVNDNVEKHNGMEKYRDNFVIFGERFAKKAAGIFG